VRRRFTPWRCFSVCLSPSSTFYLYSAEWATVCWLCRRSLSLMTPVTLRLGTPRPKLNLANYDCVTVCCIKCPQKRGQSLSQKNDLVSWILMPERVYNYKGIIVCQPHPSCRVGATIHRSLLSTIRDSCLTFQSHFVAKQLYMYMNGVLSSYTVCSHSLYTV